MHNRVALVTGASTGIGKAIALRLLNEEWVVYAGARRLPLMEDLKAKGAKVLCLDVTLEESMVAAVNQVLETEGHIDALINNAGYGAYGAIENVAIDEVRRQFEVNVFGLARMSQLVLPAMREAHSGTIVNIGSMGGKFWMPIGGWYHATKHVVEVISDAMRYECAPFGVHVVVVEPGSIKTEWAGISAQGARTAKLDSAYRELEDKMANLLESDGHPADPDVIAKVVSVALNSPHPRRRYAAPLDAKILIFVHWLLPAPAWEALIRMAIRRANSKKSG
jgi:NAD(P)-dependent dehydrogenase (short-subunit alcohol dehydrogenase family)